MLRKERGIRNSPREWWCHTGEIVEYIQQKTWGLSIVGTIFEIYMKFEMSVRHSVGVSNSHLTSQRTCVCLELRGHVQVTDTQAAVTNMYAIEGRHSYGHTPVLWMQSTRGT